MTAVAESAVRSPQVHAGLPRSLLEVSYVNGQSAVTRSLSHSPLKLVVPRSRGRSAWAFTSTFGGGLVSGDAIDLDIQAGGGTTTLLSTQASTKVYRATGARATKQTLHAAVKAEAVLVVAPDPVMCFAGAIYEQRQRFDVNAGGGLVLIDWLTSGRIARGERWAFNRYFACNEVAVDGLTVYRDVMLLDPRDGPLSGSQRMGKFNCLASVLIAGEPLRRHADALVEYVARHPIGGELLFSVSPLKAGVVLRVAGDSTQSVGAWIHRRLAFLVELLGEDFWARKG